MQPCPMGDGLGNVTYFTQWKVSRSEVHRGLKYAEVVQVGSWALVPH